MKAALFLVLILLGLPTRGWAEVLSQLPDENNHLFFTRILPKEAALMHPPIRGRFGPSDHNLLLLFQTNKSGVGPFEGMILVPNRNVPGSYTKHILPIPDGMVGLVDVHAVFFVNADKKEGNELLILCSQMSGMGPDGAKEWYQTYVYGWNGNGFELQKSLLKKLSNLRTSAEVKRVLTK